MSTDKLELNNLSEPKTESESESNSESEYEEFDLSDNPNYQVLAAFFEDDIGNNICDHISKLTEAINSYSKKIYKILERLSNTPKQVSSPSSKKGPRRSSKK